VVSAHEAIDALRVARETRPDVVVMNAQLAAAAGSWP
jgi:hypothetical protein